MVLKVLTALAEPTRLKTMRLLEDGAEHCVCELMMKLGTRQSRMSRHMKVLREAGLVLNRRDAQWVRYRRNPNLVPQLVAVIDAVLAAEHQFEEEVA